MKKLFSHFLSACLGAFLVVIVMIGFDKLSTIYPIYVPNIFYKEQINYTVNVDSKVSEAIDETGKNVVQVNNYLGNKLRSAGSGVIYKLTNNRAYIVTNNHVVEDASKIEIETTHGYRVMGQIVGTDPVTDLAVISIPKGTIDYYMEFSDSHAIKVGEYVIAIGNPLGLSGSATLGIVSSKERLVPIDTDNDGQDDWYASVLQTDAPINPGNSGGALINLDGKLVGINSMKIAESNVEGIGFSIPSNLVSRVISELEVNGVVNRPTRLLGITIQGINYENQFALQIVEVTPNSLASTIDLEVDDIILEINTQEIMQYFDLKYYLSTTKVNEKVSLTIIRDNKTIIKDIPIT
ncbi:trypsin-like peptidase domain-containing protein [Mycoplasmatota bacterium]|nr:trypsin-like peptidase domain-containing protein [Mycoplasmatota bacterium]